MMNHAVNNHFYCDMNPRHININVVQLFKAFLHPRSSSSDLKHRRFMAHEFVFS